MTLRPCPRARLIRLRSSGVSSNVAQFSGENIRNPVQEIIRFDRLKDSSSMKFSKRIRVSIEIVIFFSLLSFFSFTINGERKRDKSTKDLFLFILFNQSSLTQASNRTDNRESERRFAMEIARNDNDFKRNWIGLVVQRLVAEKVKDVELSLN